MKLTIVTTVLISLISAQALACGKKDKAKHDAYTSSEKVAKYDKNKKRMSEAKVASSKSK